MSQPHTLYGMPVSMFTGKIRSYLRKRAIPFHEVLVTHPRFAEIVLPGLDRFIFPVLETADGEIIQDTSDIIHHFEARLPPQDGVIPSGPRQRLVALILELFGDESLVRAGMHYRWNFPDQNRRFLERSFAAGIAPRSSPDEAAAIAGPSMAKMAGYLAGLGITERTIPAIEHAYENLLETLDDHFRAVPYLLGGQASIGDFGLLSSFFAHLARDPYPADQMKNRAYAVWRWVERMNVADADMPEFADLAPRFMAADAIPETLEPVLRCVAEIMVPELSAQVEGLDAWLSDHPEIVAGRRIHASERESRPRGQVSFELNGTAMDAGLRPFSVWKLQAVTDAFDGLDPKDQTVVRNFMDGVGLSPLLALKASRRLSRVQNRDVWGDRLTP